MKNKKKIKLGIIGKNFGYNVIYKSFVKNNDYKIVGFSFKSKKFDKIKLPKNIKVYFNWKKLILDKKYLIKHLIRFSRDSKEQKRHAIELMQIDYDYDNLKGLVGGGEKKIDTSSVHIPDDYQTNYSIGDIIEENTLDNDDLALLDNYDTNHSIKELLR